MRHCDIAQQIDDEHGNVEEERMTGDEVTLEELFHKELIALGEEIANKGIESLKNTN